MSSSEANAPDPLAPLTGLWSGFFACLDSQNKLILECLEPASDPLVLQKRWLEATSRAIDVYLRSPAFAQTMGSSLRTLADCKAIQDRLTSDWARQLGLPIASDMHELADRMRGVEGTLRSRLKAIEDRLADIERQLTTDRVSSDRTTHEDP
jgi:hypothetical protein